ncbi:MAG TPA: chlororespiratory reduction 6 domain-containing protein, partial [Noviherbaspirillum sp.]|nr:chlororespiratory reduction 6 domain-containing protein [Noviherbaspirillum sp.]
MSTRNLYGGLVGTKVVVITIQREDIERRKIEPALSSLNRLIDSQEALEASNGTISLMVSGYDDDPRELHLIPEVRTFFLELDEQFPFWFHVCTRIE